MRENNAPLTSIAIFGQSHALWPVATLMETMLPDRIALILIENMSSSELPGAASLACDNPFFEQIGFNARDLVRDGTAMLGLGTDCQDWREEGSRFFTAPSGKLPAVNDIALHHIMLRAAKMHGEPDRLAYLFQPLRFAARVAQTRKFADRSDDPNSPLRMLAPTIQFDRGAFGAQLKPRFPQGRAQIVTGEARDAVVGEGGVVRSVTLSDGQHIAADMFVDVSGELSRLVQNAEPLRTHSLAHIMPFDRVARSFDAGKEPLDHLHTIARALPGGMVVETALQNGIASELLFSAEAADADGASSSFAPGFCENPWTGNYVRLGGAAAQLGPYQSADMMLLLEQAGHLVRAIPATRSMDIEATEFNRNQLGSARQLRDFLALPFVLNGRDEPLWADIRDADRPAQLRLRLSQFASRGRFVEFDHELFDEQSWIEMMIGFGVTPDRYDPSTDYLDMKRLAPLLKQMVGGLTQAIEAMPRHGDYMHDMITAARQVK